MENDKDFLKSNSPSDSSVGTESTFTILSSNVNVDINLGSLGEPDNMEVTVDTPNLESNMKVDGSLSTTQAALLPENLVLVETSKGLVLSVADNMNFSSACIATATEDQGRTIITSSLPAGIFTQIQQVGVMDDQQGGVYETIPDGQVVTSTAILQPQQPPQQCDMATDQAFLVTSQGETNQEEKVPKKKSAGGWPKGKKRKIVPDVQAPRKPMTGYVIFAVKRRQEIRESNPELQFSEVTRLLGQEWSNLATDEKKAYMEMAEEDKTRYIREMEAFEKSDLYQTYLKNRKMEGEGTDGNPLIDLEGNVGVNELYCKVCNQYFISIHNKREHMFGRQHLQNITDEIKKDIQQQTDMQKQQMLLATSVAGVGDLDMVSGLQNGIILDTSAADKPTSRTSESLDINEFIQEFIRKNLDRDSEIQLLRKCKQDYEEDKVAITKQIKELEEYETKLDQDLGSLKAYGASLTAQIDALKMVPTLFGVINF